MIVFKTVTSAEEIFQLLELQKNNLLKNLSEEEINTQGFVTVIHDYETLKKMNNIEPSIIAKKDDLVIGYLLAMTKKSKNDIPVLIPMFNVFENIHYNSRKISAYNYLVVGQVCIAQEWRGQGILDDCYAAYRKHFCKKYDFAITEIQTKNQRSVKAYLRVGFSIIHSYEDENHDGWEIVLWDWKSESKR
ncbi:hypothetical protein BH20BAC1_BH20BAC1_05610 [soil metagenome]